MPGIVLEALSPEDTPDGLAHVLSNEITGCGGVGTLVAAHMRGLIVKQNIVRGTAASYGAVLPDMGNSDTVATMVAARALTSVGLTLEEARRRVEDVVGRGQDPPDAHIPFSPGAKKAFESALREGLALRHSYIGTPHILLGLIGQPENVTARILIDVRR